MSSGGSLKFQPLSGPHPLTLHGRDANNSTPNKILNMCTTCTHVEANRWHQHPQIDKVFGNVFDVLSYFRVCTCVGLSGGVCYRATKRAPFWGKFIVTLCPNQPPPPSRHFWHYLWCERKLRGKLILSGNLIIIASRRGKTRAATTTTVSWFDGAPRQKVLVVRRNCPLLRVRRLIVKCVKPVGRGRYWPELWWEDVVEFVNAERYKNVKILSIVSMPNNTIPINRTKVSCRNCQCIMKVTKW